MEEIFMDKYSDRHFTCYQGQNCEEKELRM